MTTYRVAGLGCKVNQYEAEQVAEGLAAAGMAEADDGRPADVVVVNTCAVTATAVAGSAKLLRRLARENPGARLVVAGCLVTHLGREEALRRTGAHLALTQDEKLSPDGLRAALGAVPAAGIRRFAGHSRAFIKVQDGCSAGCSYCVVPSLRGKPRSRSLAKISAEARALGLAGYRELVICGVHLGWFGRDLEGSPRPELCDAVEAVLAAAPRARVRLSSLAAAELSSRLLELAAAEPRVCPHFHLPLQSGDDGVLSAMRRPYTAAEFLAAVERVRAKLDRPAVTTDLIVGFPGETTAAFEGTLDVCRRAGFSRTHVFRYSPRKGTPAAELPGRVGPEESRRRAAEATKLARELAADFARSCVGREEEVLLESRRGGYTGRYVRTEVAGTGLTPGELYRVKITRAEGGGVEGGVEHP